MWIYLLIQDGFPIRLKHMHVIKQPWYISIVMMLIWPFLKEKLRQRVSDHMTLQPNHVIFI